jgi:hypothetical protein
MKTRLLIILCLGIYNLNAQTTHNLNWFVGIGSNVNLTIEIGDTVKWTWTSANHTVTSDLGSTETFDSGSLGPIGSTFQWTFTEVGTNPYFCDIHGPASMSGTITVQNSLGIDDNTLSNFKLYPNPSNSILKLEFPSYVTEGKVTVFDVLGKEFIMKSFNTTNSLEINTSIWSQGIYLIKVQSGNSSLTKQFIKN